MTRLERSEQYQPRNRAPVDYPESHILCAETVHDGDGVVVFVRGELDLASGPALGRRILELLSLPITWLTVDLAELGFVDSSGIAMLNNARIAAEEHNICFQLAAIPHQAQRVLELTTMDELFTFVDRSSPLHRSNMDGI
jgi:anti-sigma B factor antagonist